MTEEELQAAVEDLTKVVFYLRTGDRYDHLIHSPSTMGFPIHDTPMTELAVNVLGVLHRLQASARAIRNA